MSHRAKAIFVGWLISGGAAFSQGPPVFPGELIATGPSPTAVTAVDVNGDGAVDLVVAGDSTAYITVALAMGGGTFSKFNYAVGGSSTPKPYCIEAGDLNGDGHVDLVTSNAGSNDLTVLMGIPIGGPFWNIHNVQVPAANSYLGEIALGDLNGDGKLDAVVASYGYGSIYTFLGNGVGGLAPQATVMAVPSATFVELADLNGDGKLDLAIGGYQSSSLGLMKWGGHPAGFQPPILMPLSIGGFLYGIVARDLDGDGDVDLAGSASAFVDVFTNNGSGAFSAPSSFASSVDLRGMTCGDVNMDGVPDLAAGTVTGSAAVFVGFGNGAFAPPTFHFAATVIGGLAIAELTGDAMPDVVVCNPPAGGLALLRSVGYGGALTAPIAIPYVGPLSAVCFADLQGDGKQDLVTSAGLQSSLPLVRTYVGNGHGAFTPSVYVSFGNSHDAVTGLVALDLDADGFVDFAASVKSQSGWSYGELDVFRQSPATGAFLPLGTYPAIHDPIAVASGDLNNDGSPDLGMLNTFPDVYQIFTNFGFGQFSALGAVATGGVAPRQLHFADMNLDGNLDLLVSHYGTGTIVVHPGNGSGQFSSPQATLVGALQGGFHVSDINGDGLPDVAAGSGFQGIAVLFGVFPGVLGSPPLSLYTGGACFDAVIADFDGDGLQDLASGHFGQSGVSVFLGKPGGTFGAQLLLAAGTSPRFLDVADVHGDGKLDLAVGDYDWGLTVFPNISVTPGLYPYGTGTPGCSGTQTLHGTSSPKVGNAAFAIQSHYGPASSLELGLVMDAANLPGFDPFGLGILFHVNPIASVFAMPFDLNSDSVGFAAKALPIPNQPQIQGSTYYAQVISLWPGANCALLPFGLSSSQGLQIVIQ